MAKNITVDNFEKEVLQAAGPVLVDFWATWCGPCRMQGPAVEKLAEEGYNVGKINVDDEGELAERYHVMNIPTLIIFKNGEEKERMVGVQSKVATGNAVAAVYTANVRHCANTNTRRDTQRRQRCPARYDCDRSRTGTDWQNQRRLPLWYLFKKP